MLARRTAAHCAGQRDGILFKLAQRELREHKTPHACRKAILGWTEFVRRKAQEPTLAHPNPSWLFDITV
jgi:hypothetical protein